MTEQEQKLIADNIRNIHFAVDDPFKLWQDVHAKTLERVKEVIITPHAQGLMQLWTNVITQLQDIITTQSEELAIFRELETRIVVGKLDDETLKLIIERLLALRFKAAGIQADE